MRASSNPLFTLSVDVESWVHGRWASGSDRSIWPDSRAAYAAAFGSDRLADDFVQGVRQVLGLLEDLQIPATFFMLVEVARQFPTLAREIAGGGHEVALHGMQHIDNSRLTPERFLAMIRESRGILADMAGCEVVGYRAPNLIIDSAQLALLDAEGFQYDSSVCPSRRFFGKFSNMSAAPMLPYHPARSDLARPGELRIVELPLPVFPGIRLPAGTGIMTRVVGGWWTRAALSRTLARGYGLYYFHPYEIGRPFPLPRDSAYLRLFTRNIGQPFERFLRRYLGSLRGRVAFVVARDLAGLVRRGDLAFV